MYFGFYTYRKRFAFSKFAELLQCLIVICHFLCTFEYKFNMAFSFDAVTPLVAAYVCALTVLFIILAFICQRKTWLWVGMTAICAMAVAFLVVPGYILKIQVLCCVSDDILGHLKEIGTNRKYRGWTMSLFACYSC